MQIQKGGLDLISVSDDENGIPPRDLPLACTRFATSKLVNVDDLKSMIRTFGFHGEALASASMLPYKLYMHPFHTNSTRIPSTHLYILWKDLKCAVVVVVVVVVVRCLSSVPIKFPRKYIIL